MPRWLGWYPDTRFDKVMLIFDSSTAGFDIFDDDYDYDRRPNTTIDASDFILDIREYDVPYHVRVAIDKGTPDLPPNAITLTTL